MDVALIGCGFIGRFIARHIASGELPLRLTMVMDRHDERVRLVQGMFSEPPAAATDIRDITASDAGLVIEAASIGAVKEFARPILSSGKDMMAMSVGAFADPELYEGVERLCMERGVKVYLPSGAVGGLDAVLSASMGGLSSVELTTTKHPRSLVGAPYLIEQGIDLSGIKEPKLIFEGSAGEAIEGFPSNVNVAVALSLVGLGAERTRVRIIVDPEVDSNIHEIRAEGDFGRLLCRTENLPAPENPRTSRLAALSAISMLKKIGSPLKVG